MKINVRGKRENEHIFKGKLVKIGRILDIVPHICGGRRVFRKINLILTELLVPVTWPPHSVLIYRKFRDKNAPEMTSN
jgi:hypothetical protein